MEIQPPAPANHRHRGRRGRHAAGATGLLVAGGAVTLLAEAVWTARRNLPSLVGLDATGTIDAPGPATSPPLRLVALGDSTLTGPGLASPAEIWLRQALEGLAFDGTIELTSLAVGGSRAADVRAVVPRALDLEPDLVVLAVGSNDAIHGTGSRAFTATLDAIVSEVLEQVPAIGVCNIGDLGNLARVPPPLTSVLRRRSAQVRRQIEDVVERHPGAVLLDVTASNPGFRDRSVFADDLFHPNASGHALWAESARPGLAQLLATAAARRTATTS